MIKCEQIFSSFSTLIKNGLSIQRKLATEQQLPEVPRAEKVRENHSETSEGWLVVAWGQGPRGQLPRAPQALPAEGSRGLESSRPRDRAGTEAGGGRLWGWGRGQSRDRGGWLSKQVCPLDLREGQGGKQKGFHFHKPSLLGSPPFGVGTGYCPQEGVRPDTENSG